MTREFGGAHEARPRDLEGGLLVRHAAILGVVCTLLIAALLGAHAWHHRDLHVRQLREHAGQEARVAARGLAMVVSQQALRLERMADDLARIAGGPGVEDLARARDRHLAAALALHWSEAGGGSSHLPGSAGPPGPCVGVQPQPPFTLAAPAGAERFALAVPWSAAGLRHGSLCAVLPRALLNEHLMGHAAPASHLTLVAGPSSAPGPLAAPVQGTPWRVVARLDPGGGEAHLRHLLAEGAVTLSLVAAFAAVLVWLVRREAGRRLAELAVRRSSEEQLQLLLSSTAEGIYGMDGSGVCTFCNPAAVRMLGYRDASELVGRDIHAMVHRERRDGGSDPRNECHILRAFDQGEGVHVEDDVFWRADGSALPVEYWSYPVRREGRVMGVVVTFLDITERRRSLRALEDSEARLRMILEHMPVLMSAVDSALNFVAWNQEAERVTGYRAEEVIGNPRAAEMLFPDREYRERMVRELIERDNLFRDWEWRLTARDGSERVIAWSSISRNFPVAGWFGWGVGVDVTERRRAERALAHSERRLRLIMEQVPAIVWTTDTELRFTSSMGAGLEALGLIPNQVTGQSLHAFFATDDPQYPPIAAQRGAIAGESVSYETAWAGNVYHAYVEPLHDAAGQVVGAIGIALDVSERKRAEQALYAEKERLQVTLHSIGEAVISTDAEGRIEYLNPVAEALTGWPLAEARGRPLTQVFRILDERTREPLDDPVGRVLELGEKARLAGDAVLLSRTGREYAVQDSASPIRGRDGGLLGVVLVFNDVTESRRMARQMAHQATHDPLTGLVNRREFERRLMRAVDSAREHEVTHALCYMDLDAFKAVNDSAGHAAGDELLRQVTALLAGRVRSRDTLGRLGGDEFGLLLESCPLEKATTIAEGLVEAVHDFRFVWREQAYRIGVSVGLVMVGAGAEEGSRLLALADGACYAAKREGRGQVRLAKREAPPAPMAGLPAHELRAALREQRLVFYCQPIVSLRDPRAGPACWEFLVRLRTGEGRHLPPGAFMAVAERAGLLADLDRWVVREALGQYHARVHASPGARIGINLSAAALEEADWPEHMAEALKEAGVPATRVCLDVEEEDLMARLSQAGPWLERLHALGCCIAVDGFGAALGTFGYLKDLPVDYLKLELGLGRRVADSPVDRALVKGIVDVAHALEIQVIATGVESEAAVAALRELGVDLAQGFALGRPEPFRPADSALRRQSG
jgi:diguanylate cyclase (GGDEF)-like protein/PAS domain S-box-containing protein